ncbi:hypothetical protein [Nostoc sp.]
MPQYKHFVPFRLELVLISSPEGFVAIAGSDSIPKFGVQKVELKLKIVQDAANKRRFRNEPETKILATVAMMKLTIPINQNLNPRINLSILSLCRIIKT